MSTIYLGGVVVIGIVILFYYHSKSGGRVNKKQITPEIAKEVNTEITKEIKPEILFCYHSKSNSINRNQIIPNIAKKNIPEIPKEIKPEMATKNKWLYPTDEFGKMEKGVVSESITYLYELNENTNNIIYKIKPKPNKRSKIKKLNDEKEV